MRNLVNPVHLCQFQAREVLKDALGLTDDDIIKIPAVYESNVGGFPFMPGIVNMQIVLDDSDPNDTVVHLLVPCDPFDPSDQTDYPGDPNWSEADANDDYAVSTYFETMVTGWNSSSDYTYELHWVNDAYDYHYHGGEVHCGSNVQRIPANGGKWW